MTDAIRPPGGDSVGPGTRAVHAGLPDAVSGEPFLPGPSLASAFHHPGEVDPSIPHYARYGTPTGERYERALGELEGGEALAFASGMAAVTAATLPLLSPGDVLVAPSDGYPALRELAGEHLATRDVEVRFVPTDDRAITRALPGARLVWLETPSNPGLDVCDVRALAHAAHAKGALVAVDNTLATPLGQQPLALGADLSVVSGTKALSGHTDLLIGYVATRDPDLLAAVRTWRDRTGAVAGPFETWLAHRSLATLDLRLERQATNALALASALRDRAGVTGVRYPGLPEDPAHAVAAHQMRRFGPVVAFTLPDRGAAERFLAGASLVADATSFGGVHTTAERRARWAMDDVAEGFIRLSAGIEDPEDLLADVGAALDVALAVASHERS